MDSRLKLILKGNPEEVLMLLIRLKSPETIIPNCEVITQFGDIISCRVKRKYLLEIYNSADTLSVKAPRLVTSSLYNESNNNILPHLKDADNPSRKVQNAYSGEGVYFATVDWGFDIAHRNLREADGTTRFKCFWDQNGIYDGNKYGYGCFYSADEINDALSTDTPYQTLGYHPGKEDVFDAGMHGTHVIDIATGTPVVGEGGVANKCRIVGVQLGNNFVNGSDLALGDSVKLIEALDYIYSVTQDAPCVINMSLGSHGDSHTGKSLAEIAFDNFLNKNPGYAIVQSVGNYYTANCHIQNTIQQDEKYNIEWNIPRRNFAPDEVEIWYPGTDEFSLRLISPDGEAVADVPAFKDIQISYHDEPFGYIFHRAKEPNTGLNHIDIILDVSILKGKWIIELIGTKIKDGAFHAYCERNDASQSTFSAYQISPYTTTGSVCNSKNTITVGAYNHREIVKPVVSFSSSGPTVFGQPKPDLLAPGYKIKAARSAAAGDYTATNQLAIKSGSSMAAPHVAGAIALLFQKHLPKRLPIEKVKQLLFNSLDSLPATFSKQDTDRSGNGYLNIIKLLEPVKNVNMNTSYITRPISRRKEQDYLHAEDYNESPEYHAPYLHKDCSKCTDELLKEIKIGSWAAGPDLLSTLSKTYFNNGPASAFDVYRHFHPSYQYNYSPYEISFSPVTLPGSLHRDSLQAGDIILSRLALSGKTVKAIITEPDFLNKETLNGSSSAFDKQGLYVKAYGNKGSNGNEKMYVRVADANNITPYNVIILRVTGTKEKSENTITEKERLGANITEAGTPSSSHEDYLAPEEHEYFTESRDEDIKQKADIQSEIISLTAGELKLWEGKHISEMETRIKKYWKEGVNFNNTEAKNSVATGEEWSAAFVSYVMRKATNNIFLPSSAHNRYTVWAKQNETRRPNVPFRIFEIDQVTIEVGDIIVNAREEKGPIATFQNITDPDVRPKAHGDIVIEIDETTNQAKVAGGNKGFPGVKSIYIDLTSSGKVLQKTKLLKSGKGTYNLYIAVIKLMPDTIDSFLLPDKATEDFTENDIDSEDYIDSEDDTSNTFPSLYDNLDLQLLDNDVTGRYGGIASRANAGKNYVTTLQNDLKELGYGFGPAVTGSVDVYTMQAVKEFQIYAKMHFVAEQQIGPYPVYSDSLRQVANTQIYTGPVSGIVNAETRRLIQLWKQNHWRCPVVIEAWNMHNGTRTNMVFGNLWKYDDDTNKAQRIFARDFSNYYSAGTLRNLTDRQVLGSFTTFHHGWSGPQSVPPKHCWPEAEILPTTALFPAINIASPVFNQLTPAQQSTFRVIRAVSEVEPQGFYDGINAYDDVFISVGPFHMPVGQANDAFGGELGGFLSFFKEHDPAEFDRLFGFSGIQSHITWNGNGSAAFKSGSRRFSTTLDMQNNDSTFSQLRTSDVNVYNWFRSWHWFYRFAMAGRTSSIYQKALWIYARLRLQVLVNTEWGDGLQIEFTNASGARLTRPVVLGDVFTSEKAIAVIFRWHVRFPAHVVNQHRVTHTLKIAAANSGISLVSPLVINLTDEQTLADNLATMSNINTINSVKNWPEWVPKTINPNGGQSNYYRFNLDISFCNPLSAARNVNGFPLDTSDLPPLP